MPVSGGAAPVVVAVDIGGTFTDGVLVDDQARVLAAKVLSTPDDPSGGFFHALEVLMQQSGLAAAGMRAIGHATTVATNAIIEGTLRPTAMITTAGFRDILEIGRQVRPHLYDFFAVKPEPLVPRDLVFEVRERVGPGGQIETPLDEEQARQVLREIAGRGVSAIVICLLHAYANPEHELRLEQLARTLVPGLRVARSSFVSPRLGEYARACTTALNAGLLPIVGDYAERIRGGLSAAGLNCPIWVMQSSGGAMSLEATAASPVNMIESGPAAGIQAAVEFGKRLDLPSLLTLDMGGTTTKVAVVLDHKPLLIHDYEVGARGSGAARAERGRGYPINSPVIDVIEVGTGGGSIAWIDAGGRFRVGPLSAGAVPGPACYARGGTHPTVTDASLVLGLIPVAEPLGGEIVLSRDLAERALMEDIGRPLGLELTTAAAGVVEIAEASMARAIYSVTVDRGHDPADFTMMAFGGAAPLYACSVAEEVGVTRVVIPPVPGVFSALGVVLADVRIDLVETHLAPLVPASLEELQQHLDRLAATGRAAVEAEGVPASDVEIIRTLATRYRGQSGILDISVGPALAAEDLSGLRQRLGESHQREFGFVDFDDPIEVVNVGITALGHRPHRARVRSTLAQHPTIHGETRAVIDRDRGLEAIPLIGRGRIEDHTLLNGPVLVLDSGSTTVVRPGWNLRVEQDCLVLRRGERT